MATDRATGATIRLLQDQLSAWVDEQFESWGPARGQPKVVRDPIHDFIWLEPHEVAIWDTPVLQRLRYIHQTALTYLAYPGANHTRLDHSIGTLEVSQRMLEAISRWHSVDEGTRVHVRLAALLHDVGHVLLSHLGESIVDAQFPAILHALKREPYDGIPRFFAGVALGETLAFLIITSDSFRQYIDEHVLRRHGYTERGFALNDIDFSRIGRMIIGRWAPGEPRWATQIVNGSFDADKLDYIWRDCHYTGIRAEIDTSRLVHSLTIVDSQSFPEALGVRGGSMNYLEQIIMAKLTLYSAVYHHHKVRTLECMFKAFYERLADQGTESPFLPASIPDFLRVSEHDFFSKGTAEPLAGEIARRLMTRQLLKRCLVLDRTTILERSWTQLHTLATDLKEPARQRELREKIFSGLPSRAKTDVSDLWIDIPNPPDVDQEAQHCLVVLAPGEVRRLSDLVPTAGWVRGYAVNKLRGHVFYDGKFENREQVAAIAEQVLKEEYDIELTPLARALALKSPARGR